MRLFLYKLDQIDGYYSLNDCTIMWRYAIIKVIIFENFLIILLSGKVLKHRKGEYTFLFLLQCNTSVSAMPKVACRQYCLQLHKGNCEMQSVLSERNLLSILFYLQQEVIRKIFDT